MKDAFRTYNALSFDDEDFEEDDMQLLKVSALYDIERHNKMAQKIYYSDKLKEMIPDALYASEQQIRLCSDICKQHDVQYNPHLDHNEFKLFVDMCRGILGDDADLNWIDTSEVTDMRCLFSMTQFNGDITMWDVSNVKDMQYIFYENKVFNLPIGNWDVSNVKAMNYMFYKADAFNLPIGDWDVSSVTHMNGLFHHTKIFNLDISNWDVSSVINMAEMFAWSNFNNDISNWDVSSVKDMRAMFFASKFDLPIGNWDVSSVNDMSEMFESSIFDQDISNWDVSSVTYTQNMFKNSFFCQDLSRWDLSRTTHFTRQHMFSKSNMEEEYLPLFAILESYNALSFDDDNFEDDDIQLQKIGASEVKLLSRNRILKPVYEEKMAEFCKCTMNSFKLVEELYNFGKYYKETGAQYRVEDEDELAKIMETIMIAVEIRSNIDLNWLDVSNILNMVRVFKNMAFYPDISEWNVSNVKNMTGMFADSLFNGDLSKWDVSNVELMSFMFANSAFNNDSIVNWDLSSLKLCNGMFTGSAMHLDLSMMDLSHIEKHMITNMFASTPYTVDDLDMLPKTDFDKQLYLRYI